MAKPRPPAEARRAKAGRRWKRIALAALLVVVAVALVPVLTRGSARAAPVTGGTGAPIDGDVLRVMTLNLAHGRADGAHQLLLDRDAVEANLAAVEAVLDRERPHVVALQEADGPSFWSGGFDHVALLAGDRAYARAENVRGLGLAYGAALLSAPPLVDAAAVTFEPTWPTMSKGFVVGSIRWGTSSVDVVSVHLDFASAAAREEQLAHLARALAGRGRPIVVMGDFNEGWNGLRDFAAALNLQAWQPDEPLPTFDDKRIDWILVSEELAIRSCRVLEDAVSDHRAVVAEVERANRAEDR